MLSETAAADLQEKEADQMVTITTSFLTTVFQYWCNARDVLQTVK